MYIYFLSGVAPCCEPAPPLAPLWPPLAPLSGPWPPLPPWPPLAPLWGPWPPLPPFGPLWLPFGGRGLPCLPLAPFGSQPSQPSQPAQPGKAAKPASPQIHPRSTPDPPQIGGLGPHTMFSRLGPSLLNIVPRYLPRPDRGFGAPYYVYHNWPNCDKHSTST